MNNKITAATLALLLLAMAASCEATEPESTTDAKMPTGDKEVHFLFHQIKLDGVSNVRAEYPPTRQVQDAKDRAFFPVTIEGGGGLSVPDKVATRADQVRRHQRRTRPGRG
ncbi:MAG: hypothetical protein JRH20_21845 [Deltaproteobacteria bacterium]|nr:hypothetical protein [Deltaproteobacteria bacterium]